MPYTTAGVETVTRTETDMGEHLGDTDALVARHAESAGSFTPVPGEKFTEDQICERFGLEKRGSIRVSRTSKTIVLVNRADAQAQYRNAEYGEYIVFNGRHFPDSDDQMQMENLSLANSNRDGYDVLYFVKECDHLAFRGRVECVSDGPAPASGGRPGVGISFNLRLIGDGRGASAPPAGVGPDSVEMVEDTLLSARKFDTRLALLGSLPRKVPRESLDRILDYLVRSGKVDADGESVRWVFNDPRTDTEAQVMERCIETLAILSDPCFAMQIKESEEDLRAGRVVPWVKGRAQNTQ